MKVGVAREHQDRKFQLSKYIIPSVISMVLVGTYTNIDGFFIGNVTGDDGLAAINIVWPVVAFITSLGTGIGMGGSIILSHLRGRRENTSAEQVKTTIIVLLVLIGVGISMICKFAYKPLLVIMGAQGQVLMYAMDYADIICMGAVFQIMGSGLVALLRNEQKTYFAMGCCIAGLIVHLLLDVLLVTEYPLRGVAFSTVISQAVMMIMGLFALNTGQKGQMDVRYIPDILKASTSPFGINFVPSVVLLFTNCFALKYGGTAAVSAYAVMSYAVYTFDYIYQGICDGVQPVISYCCGAKDDEGEKHALKVSVRLLIVVTILFILLTPGLIYIMPKLFAVSDAAKRMMNSGLVIYAFSYPFKAIVKFICSYCYASKRTKLSNILIYADPILFTPLCLITLSHFLGISGIWCSLVLAQVLVSMLGILIFIKWKQ